MENYKSSYTRYLKRNHGKPVEGSQDQIFGERLSKKTFIKIKLRLRARGYPKNLIEKKYFQMLNSLYTNRMGQKAIKD